MVTQIAASSAAGDSDTPTTGHTVPAGNDRVSYLFFHKDTDTAIDSVDSFGGVTPERIDDNSFPYLVVYRAVNPAPGATAATVHLAASSLWSAHVITLEGVDQSNPNGALAYQTNSELPEIPSDPVASAVGDLCVAFGFMVSLDIAAAQGSTLSTAEPTIGTSARNSAVAYEAGAASVVMGFSCSESFGDNAIIVIPVRKVPPPVPVISDVNGSNGVTAMQANNVINGTLLSGATVEITQGSTTVSQNVTATTASTATFATTFDPGCGPHLRYGPASLRAINAVGPSEPVAITITPPAGRSYVTLTSLYSDANGRITAIPDLAVGDQLEISNVIGGTIANVTATGNGRFNVDAAVTAFTVRAWSASDNAWGPSAVQQVSNP